MTSAAASADSVKRTRITVAVVAVVLVALLFLTSRVFSTPRWSAWLQEFPAFLLIGGLLVLPLVGFPLTILLIAVGARFGVSTGIGIAACAAAVHLLLSFPLAEFFRRPVTALLRRAHWELPKVREGAAWPFCLWIALVPGLSYTLKNYLAPLAGAPFRVYFLCYYPVHLATSLIGLMLGGATVHFSWPLVAGIAVYAVVLFVLTRTLAARFRSRAA